METLKEMNSRAECELRYLMWEVEWNLRNRKIEKALESLKNANIVANRLFGKEEECSKEK